MYKVIVTHKGIETRVIDCKDVHQANKIEDATRRLLRIADPNGIENDCYSISEEEYLENKKAREVFNTLTDKEKQDIIEVDGKRFVRKIYEGLK